jgi:hypothetical protein
MSESHDEGMLTEVYFWKVSLTSIRDPSWSPLGLPDNKLHRCTFCYYHVEESIQSVKAEGELEFSLPK